MFPYKKQHRFIKKKLFSHLMFTLALLHFIHVIKCSHIVKKTSIISWFVFNSSFTTQKTNHIQNVLLFQDVEDCKSKPWLVFVFFPLPLLFPQQLTEKQNKIIAKTTFSFLLSSFPTLFLCTFIFSLKYLLFQFFSPPTLLSLVQSFFFFQKRSIKKPVKQHFHQKKKQSSVISVISLYPSF